MSRLSPEKVAEFRAACARMRNVPEFALILDYFKERLEKHKEGLVGSAPIDVPLFQGRAREVIDILNEIQKTKE